MNGLTILQDFVFSIIVFVLGVCLGRIFIIYYTNYKNKKKIDTNEELDTDNDKAVNYSIDGIYLDIKNFKGLNELCDELTDITSKEFNLSKGFEYNGINTLYLSLLGYLWFECNNDDRTFSNVAMMIDLMEYTSYDNDYKNSVDFLFEDLKKRKPDHCAVIHYNIFLKLNINKRYEIMYMVYFALNKRITKEKRFEEKNTTRVSDEELMQNKPTLTQHEIEQAKIKVAIQGMDLELLSPELRDNRNVVLTSINGYAWALKYASDRLRDDKDVVMVAVTNWGYALQWASDRLRDDKDIVMKAIEHNGYALAFASPRLRDNGEIVKKALKERGRALRFASERLRKNEYFIKYALEKSIRAKDFIL